MRHPQPASVEQGPICSTRNRVAVLLSVDIWYPWRYGKRLDATRFPYRRRCAPSPPAAKVDPHDRPPGAVRHVTLGHALEVVSR